MSNVTTDSDQNLRRTEDRYLLHTYAKLPVSIERGAGCYVFDSKGNRYLDFYGGHCVASTGHCHARVVEAIQRQAAELIFYSNATYSSIRARAAEALLRLSGPGFYQAFLVNSGAEANENAIKLARYLTGRTEVISMEGSFHGRTYGSLSSTGIEKYRAYLNTPVPQHRIVPAGQVADAVSSTTAAVLVEPIQSMGGIITFPLRWFKEVESACREKGALLIFDEIQTGVGRTGSFLYSQQLGVHPDLTTLAKGIASGFPAGALLAAEHVAAEVGPGDLGSTFGGSPLACVAIAATLEVLSEESLPANAAEVGRHLKDSLEQLEIIKEVRGQGLLLGLCFTEKRARSVQSALFDSRILAGTSFDPAVLRLMPPLTLSRSEADHLVEVVKRL